MEPDHSLDDYTMRKTWQSILRPKIDRLSADGLLIVLLSAWWLLNVVQASRMELANDEAYYWSWVCFNGRLDWGYYDHPPMVALLIWLTSWMGGTLGVRFAILLLQPLGLYLFWKIIKPPQPTHRDVWLYAGICFAMPALQLYGLLALPDAPLLFFGVLFLWSYQRFLQQDSIKNTILMGVSMTLLAYSKYHGVLIVIFAFLSNIRVFKTQRFYVAVLLATALYVPHLWWQWRHDWCSFAYHLIERHKGFDWENPLMVWINLLIFFNPLFLWHFVQGMRHSPGANTANLELLRAMRGIVWGVILFFFAASLHGSTQVQWLLPIAMPLTALLWNYAHCHSQCQQYLGWVISAAIVVFVLLRVVAITNPLGFNGEIWNNAEQYNAIAQKAQGRPIVFENYAKAAKYAYYTGGETYCMPNAWSRMSQWSLRQDDRVFKGRDVLIETERDEQCLTILPNGKKLQICTLKNYRPVREVVFQCNEADWCIDTKAGTVQVPLQVYNPYPYDIASGHADSLRLCMHYRIGDKRPLCNSRQDFLLPAEQTVTLTCTFPLPDSIAIGKFHVGFCINNVANRPTRQSKRYNIHFERADVPYPQNGKADIKNLK
ncbi:MAG: glycosyltransferase family 39 protein [Bacteroidales bacterium]|nr:glycosyltransferase family 39 protein [Bacteroidales bacterium]